MENNAGFKLALVAAALVALVLILGKRCHQAPAGPLSPQSRPPLANQPAAAPQTKIFSSSKAFEDYQAVLMDRRRDALKMLTTGMTALSVNKEHPYIEFTTQAIARKCVPGDLDVIEHESKLLGEAGSRLVFTLEAVGSGGDSTPAKTQKVTFTQLKSGVSGRFQLIAPKEPIVLGLFLCSYQGNLADKKRQICSGLKPYKIADLIEDQRAALTAREGAVRYPKDPKIFFFQLLVAGPHGVYIYENAQTLAFNMDRLAAAINVKSHPYLTKDLQHAVGLMRRIESLPPRVTNNQITLMLPHRGDCSYVMKP